MNNKYIEFVNTNDIKISSSFEKLPISVFDIENIIFCQEQWVNQNGYHKGWTVNGFSTLLLWHIFGVIGNEQDHIRNKENIAIDYVRKAIERLNNEDDTSLLPEDAIYIWKLFSDEERNKVIELLIDICNELDGFPIARMKIIDSLADCQVSIGDYDVNCFIPMIVSTDNGAAAILPIYSDNINAIPTLFTHVLRNEDNSFINSYHIWDLKERRIIKLKDPDNDIVEKLNIFNV